MKPTRVTRDSTRALWESFAPAKPTAVFTTFWRFAVERQRIFFEKLKGAPPPWTGDQILHRYKFTNAYRASDRTSQFLIQRVIYRGSQTIDELFFRTVLFKLFNRVDTWRLLENELGNVSWAEYSFERFDRVLSEALARGERVYSAAYIMPPVRRFHHERKHRTHLELLELLMRDGVPHRISEGRTMRDVFGLLRSYPGLGDFLAFQLAIDLNYSTITDFSEMEFVIAGPGAREGIRKCFTSLGGVTESEIIRLVAARQEEAFAHVSMTFPDLWGRQLQLIDCQNLFCEVGKYSRVAHPEVTVPGGRTRIKQHYHPNGKPLKYWYPPKWRINERLDGIPIRS